MTNFRMTKEARMINDERRSASFVIGVSSFTRHSDFGFRHSTAAAR